MIFFQPVRCDLNAVFIMQRTILSIIFIISLFLSAGCAGTKTGRVAADALVPVSEENSLGRQVSSEVEQELTMHPNANVQQYVRKLGEQIVSVVNDVPSGIRFTFQVVDDPRTVNAFALPGGFIYVYSGLMAKMNTEAELAAVLSHEIAHVTRRHVAQRLVTLYGVDLLSKVALGNEPGVVTGIVATVVEQGFLLRYSREQEIDADEVGLRYMVLANYNPYGFIDFFSLMQDQPSPPEFLLTHPLPANRIKFMKSEIKKISDVPTRDNRDQFQMIKRQL